MDEAQHLRSAVIEDLRLLTNYDRDSKSHLCLTLIGQTELRRRLSLSVHEALAQRIVVRHHLTALGREEVPLYLTCLLRLAGTERPLFEPPALEALFPATSGLPRKLNLLAHHALNAAALCRSKFVAAEHVRTAMPELC